MAFDFLTTDKFAALDNVALFEPPTWTRLEPQSSAGDPRPGIEARVHDPLWLLGRQWQLGEFEGEDAGTPLTVRVVTRTTPIDRWAPMTEQQGRAFSRGAQELLEPLVEREPGRALAPGLRARAEAAVALLAALEEAHHHKRAALIANCPLNLDPAVHPDGAHAAFDPQWQRLIRLLGGRGMADGESICRAYEDAGGLPSFFAAVDNAERDALLAVVAPWAQWYRAEVAPRVGDDDCWVGERLEYRFRIGAGARILEAPAHGGGEIDWYSFDAALAATVLGVPDGAPAAAEPIRQVHALLASPLRYPGMPADRLWELEDAQVNLGLIEAEPWDLARLLVAEFALTYGNDWLVVPVDVSLGSLSVVESLFYTTTFGEHFLVQPTTQATADGRWRMFALTDASGIASEGLLMPPGSVAVQDGPALEEVLFLRDEMANMAWAVERTVQGPSGEGRDRSREHDEWRSPGAGPVPRAQLDYVLQTGVPARWIPFLPRTSGYRAVELVQGAMPAPDGAGIVPIGELLQRTDLKVLKDAEVPREGRFARRLASVTRLADGAYVRWITRRVGIGRGEGASRLAFDSAITRKPKPNS